MGTTGLTVCPACNRHVRVGEPACPFCGARVTSFVRVLEYRLKTRLNRDRRFALGAALTAVGIATASNELGCIAVYGAPCLDTDRCEISAGSGGGGTTGGGSGGRAGSGGTVGYLGDNAHTAGSTPGGSGGTGGHVPAAAGEGGQMPGGAGAAGETSVGGSADETTAGGSAGADASGEAGNGGAQ